MGSLMAGWDSPVPDPTTVKYKRNRSLTNEEIEAYWKLKKQREEEHLRAIYGSSQTHKGYTYKVKEDGPKYQRSSSLPSDKTRNDLMDMETEPDLENFVQRSGWWTRSNWAFLNEPPVLERPSNTYASQFHIASIGTSKPNNTGISA